MIQSPNPYNPYRHPQRATERRNTVIRAMNEAGYIEPKSVEDYVNAPLRVESASVDSTEAPYFVDLVRSQLAHPYDPPALRPPAPTHPEPPPPPAPGPPAPDDRPGGAGQGPGGREEAGKGEEQGRAGPSDRDRPLDRERPRPRGRAVLRDEPVQPRGR